MNAAAENNEVGKWQSENSWESSITDVSSLFEEHWS
jgi:hypothetical protein